MKKLSSFIIALVMSYTIAGKPRKVVTFKCSGKLRERINGQ